MKIQLIAALALFALPATAEEMTHNHNMAGMDAPSTMGYMAANETMHMGMDIEFTGDADVDFVRGMIAHHQGAIDMAKVVLEHGDDPEVKKLAQGVIDAQTAEIAWMQDWLAKQPQ